MVADVRIAEGSAQDFLDHDVLDQSPDRPVLAVQRVRQPTLVLGSTQPPDLVVDASSPTRRGWEVARRRSGGGLVVLHPDDGVWIDVFVPASHHRWDPDVNQAFHWLGFAFAAALAPFVHRTSQAGHTVPSVHTVASVHTVPSVHTGPLAGREAGRLYCFAGLGPGEVLVTDHDGTVHKIVGISQRRTRAGARFQCLVALRDDPQRALPLISDRYRAAMDAAMRMANGGWPLDCPVPDSAAVEAIAIDALLRAL